MTKIVPIGRPSVNCEGIRNKVPKIFFGCFGNHQVCNGFFKYRNMNRKLRSTGSPNVIWFGLSKRRSAEVS